MTRRSVAVIGAGVAGLAAAKSLLEEGLHPTAFERSKNLGGLWRYDDGVAGGGGPAYRSLQTNISRHAMGYSDHPIPDSFPDFPTHRHILRYLESYADRFGLRRHVRLQHEVVDVRRQGDRWKVRVRCDGEERTDDFDAVMVCTGRHHTPSWPDLEGRDEFEGELLHSGSYTEPTPFAGRTVLVIGTGSSGIDLAEELAPVAGRTLLSTGRGAWIIPRTINGRPADHNVTRLGNHLPRRLREAVFRRLIEGEYRARGIDIKRSGMPLPPFDLLRARLTPGKEIARLIADGVVEVVPDVSRLRRHAVELADGRREPVDVVVAATGYRMELPFLASGLVGWQGRVPRLYKYVFPPGQRDLAFVGVPWVIGAYPPVLELQARWAARVLTGRCALPAPEVMEARVDRAVRRAAREQVLYDRVQPIDYMDDLAREIGCHPRLWRHPRLLVRLLTGPFLPAQYRLDGPGGFEGAGAIVARGVGEPQ